MRVRHVHGCAFIANVDDAHPPPSQVVPDGLDVTALETEYAVNAASAQEIHDQLRYGCCALPHRSLLIMK